MIDGRLDAHVVVDALQGGAGTSTNMNVNEVLANRALQLLGRPLGDYATVSPLDDINLHQSTNDTYPTALKVAAIRALRRAGARRSSPCWRRSRRRRRQFADVVKIGRTELQDAVLTTLGREMSAYAEAFARDRWRIYKCEERLRVVNLGGTAIGTGLGAPRQYIFRVVEHLRQITGLGLARAENLVEATQNADVFVEVSGILRALASNLLKIANDLRLLSSGPGRRAGRDPPAAAAGRLVDHARQGQPGHPRGRRPGGHRRDGPRPDDRAGRRAGNLELNQFLPLVADSLLTSLDLLTGACDIFARLCVAGIEADEEQCRWHVAGSTATVTALVDKHRLHAGLAVGQAGHGRRQDDPPNRDRARADERRGVRPVDLARARHPPRLPADAAGRDGKVGSVELRRVWGEWPKHEPAGWPR